MGQICSKCIDGADKKNRLFQSTTLTRIHPTLSSKAEAEDIAAEHVPGPAVFPLKLSTARADDGGEDECVRVSIRDRIRGLERKIERGGKATEVSMKQLEIDRLMWRSP